MPLAIRQGLRFDGINNRVVSNTPIPDISLSTDFSIVLDFTTSEDVSNIQVLFANVHAATNRFAITISGGLIRTSFYDNIAHVSPKSGVILSNSFYRLAITYDAESTTITAKLNDVILTGSNTTVQASTVGYNFGTRTSGDYFFKGVIHYAKVGVSKFKFDAGQGTTLTDTSGNGNHGTISGAQWVIKKAATVKSLPLRVGNLIPQTDGVVVTNSSTSSPEKWKIRTVTGASTVSDYSMSNGVLYFKGVKAATSDIRPCTPEMLLKKSRGYIFRYKQKLVQFVNGNAGNLNIRSSDLFSDKPSFEFNLLSAGFRTKYELHPDGYMFSEYYMPPNTMINAEQGYGYLSIFFDWIGTGAVEMYFKDFVVIEVLGLKTVT